MLKKSINTVVLAGVALITIVAIGGMVWYVTLSSQKMALQIEHESMNIVVDMLLRDLIDVRNEGDRNLSDIAKGRTTIEAFEGAEEPLEKMLEHIVKGNPMYAAMFAFDLNGQVVAGSDLSGTGLPSKDYSGFKGVKKIVDGVASCSSDKVIRAKQTNRLLIFSMTAVRDGSGRLLGGLALAYDMTAIFEKYVYPLRFGKEGYAYVLDAKARTLAHPDSNMILKDISNLPFIQYMLKHESGTHDYFYKKDKFIVFRTMPQQGWKIVLSVSHEDLGAKAIEQRNVLMEVGALLVVVLIATIIIFLRTFVLTPMMRLRDFAAEVGHGNFQSELQGKYKYEMAEFATDLKAMVAEIKNKIGFSNGILDAITYPYAVTDPKGELLQLNQPLVDMLGHTGVPKDHIGRNLGEFAYNDSNKQTITQEAVSGKKSISNLEAQLPTQQGGEVEVLADAAPVFDLDGNLIAGFALFTDQTEIKAQQRKIEEQNERIATTAKEAFSVADQMAGAAEELSAQVEQSSRGADIQRGRVTETATAMEEMNATVLEVARNASSAAEGTDTTRDKAQAGTAVVRDSIEAITQVQTGAISLKEKMGYLGEQAENIGSIMDVITDIADQTNLLALNAAIEAARAGEAGRGFAVVADEVRKLAEKTMAATQEVGTAISSIQEGTREAVGHMEGAVKDVERSTALAEETGNALKEIVSLVEMASDQVRSIATASEEQSAASEEINQAVDDINRISSETADAMTQSAQAVSDLAQLAQELNTLIRNLQDA